MWCLRWNAMRVMAPQERNLTGCRPETPNRHWRGQANQSEPALCLWEARGSSTGRADGMDGVNMGRGRRVGGADGGVTRRPTAGRAKRSRVSAESARARQTRWTPEGSDEPTGGKSDRVALGAAGQGASRQGGRRSRK